MSNQERKVRLLLKLGQSADYHRDVPYTYTPGALFDTIVYYCIQYCVLRTIKSGLGLVLQSPDGYEYRRAGFVSLKQA